VLKGVFGDGPEELHIVSHDGDWEGMCHGVSWANFHKNLMGVIGLLENDRIQNQQAEKEFAAVAMEAAPTFNKKGLEEADEHVAGGWYFLPDEPDTEVANVEVIGHEILLTELLDSDRAHGLATIGHTVRFELEAETISAEEGVGIWNSEDKHMYAWPKQHGRIRYFVEAPVGFDISVENGVWGLDNVWTEAPDSGGINDYEWLQLPKTKFLEEDDPDNFEPLVETPRAHTRGIDSAIAA
nr:hypothetical protein [Vicinamibacteria bacterium]